jgi:Ca2+-binding EF-hand superfamily protein
MRHSRFILAATFALACATAAQAQTGLGNIVSKVQVAQKNFDIADKNHDGLLTKEEAQNGPVPFIRAHFDEIDKDHKGTVSKEDVANYVRSLQHPAPAAASSTH